MSILSQLAVTQAAALSVSTLGRIDYFTDSADEKLKAYDELNNLQVVQGASSASGISYALTVPNDWDGTPANAQAALDELASRVKGTEDKTDFITVTAAIDLDDVKSKAESALQSGANHSALTLDDGTNPHGTTKADTGLSNVDNTSDLNKPISTATQTALNAKKDDFTENTAFNKNFGTASGDVLEGDTRTINAGEITTLSNTSGTNTGDETAATIKTKYESNTNTNAFTDSEKTKLSGLESSKFVGEFTSLSALQTAFPTANVGSYAYVDTGVGVDVEQYIWDDTDSNWVLQQGQSTAETPASIKSKYESNPDTNAFTDSEKIKLSNQSGTNTGDETTTTIQTKRPLKTIEGQDLEGSGNINITSGNVGLGLVDNTSDLDKPISTATQTALNAKKDDFTENTAFNKDFGTSAGEVLEGDTRTINTGEITKLTNTSGTNTGDETTTSIQTKRPIKTVNGQSLEGSGNVAITASAPINSASFMSSITQNVGTLLNGTGTNIQINLTNILGPNTLGYGISGGSVTIPAAGWYKVSLKGAINTTSNNRQNTSFVVKRNLVNIAGTFVSLYTRNNNNNEGSASASNIIPQFQFSLGDTIGFYAITKGDTNQTSFTVPQECILTLEFLG